MFNPKTDKIKIIAEHFPARIKEIGGLFAGKTNIYIDEANVRSWFEKLGWHIDYKRLKQFLDSFDNVQKIKIYKGNLIGDAASEQTIKDLERMRYEVKTKKVKIMRQSIDATSINLSDPALLKKFIRKCLLRKYDVQTVEQLNKKFEEMNKQGIYFIEDLKCNFDVEIGRDMLLDYERNNADTFILWSGDSDFADTMGQLLADNKKAVLFSTARRVATEFNQLKMEGLLIFDIQKIKNFICWNKEIEKSVADNLESKGDPGKGTPKL